MNTQPSRQEILDDARFDRLVDGELSAEEYRSLLAALDDEPAGWRRCALAFLESQALRRELGAACHVPRATPQALRIARGGTVRAAWKLAVAMAASFLVAFTLGVYGPGWLSRPEAGPPLAGPTVPPIVPEMDPPSAAPTRSPSPIGNVRLVVNGPGGMATEATELPVYEMSAETADWLRADLPAVPTEWVRELERRGHRIEREQQYVPLLLEDGRQVIVPVEGYQITPAARRPY